MFVQRPILNSYRINAASAVWWFLVMFRFAGTADGQSVAGKVPQTAIELQITANDTPPGGTAQIRIALAAPIPIAGGNLSMELDPSVFGSISAVDVFSATGDQMGFSRVQDRHLDVQFYSISGGIGRLPSMPMVVVSVPVLTGAAKGSTGNISVSSTSGPWKDVQGNQYLPSDTAARLKAGGELSINAVTPGGGLLAAGTTVQVDGLGFIASSVVEIDGVVLRSAQLKGPQSFQLTLGASVDLTGKRVTVRNPDGTRAEFYCALRGRGQAGTSPGPIVPIFPLSTFMAVDGSPMVQNPSTMSIEVIYRSTSQRGVNVLTLSRSETFQPGEIRTSPPTIIGIGSEIGRDLSASSPVRMLDYTQPQPNTNGLPVPSLTAGIPLSFGIGWSGGWPSCSTSDPFLGLRIQPACVVWIAGSPAPKPLAVSVGAQGPATKFSAAIKTEDGGNWVSMSPAEGTTCPRSSTCSPTNLVVNFRTESLKPGVYSAAITVTPESSDFAPQSLLLTVRVATSPIAVDGPPFLNFIASSAGTEVTPIELQVTSVGDPVPFTAFVRNPQGPFGDWLSVSQSANVTPATVTVTANPGALRESNPGAINYVTIQGQGNSVTRLVMLQRLSPQPPVLSTSLLGNSITVWIKQGMANMVTRFFSVSPYAADDVRTVTDGALGWLKAVVGRDANGTPGVNASIDPTGLSDGVYHGTITAVATTHSEYTPASVDVNLIVWSTPPPISVSPQTLEISLPSGGSLLDAYREEPNSTTLRVTSNGTLVDSTGELAASDGNTWLSVLTSTAPRYGNVYFGADARNLPPGDYEATVRITAPSGSSNSITVPVHLKVTPALPRALPAGPPLAVTVVNGASQISGAVAPGEIVSIYGMNIGPSPYAEPGANGPRVYFGGMPAPVLFASATQVNAMVPFEVTGMSVVDLVMEFGGAKVAAGGLPLVPFAPGIFTVGGSGVGQANALNQDGASNGADHPADAGSIVQLFVTGVGRASGGPVSVTIGGISAVLRDAAPLQGAVDGLVQLRVTVPPGVKPGAAVPVQLTAGPASSPAGVTLAIR